MTPARAEARALGPRSARAWRTAWSTASARARRRRRPARRRRCAGCRGPPAPVTPGGRWRRRSAKSRVRRRWTAPYASRVAWRARPRIEVCAGAPRRRARDRRTRRRRRGAARGGRRCASARSCSGPQPPAAPISRGPRQPRRNAAASIRPCRGLELEQLERPLGPATSRPPSATSGAGASSTRARARQTLNGSPPIASVAPTSGDRARTWRARSTAGRERSRGRSSGAILGASETLPSAGDRLETAGGELVEHLAEQRPADLAQPRRQRAGVLVVADRDPAGRQHRAGVEAGVHLHDRHARAGRAVHDRVAPRPRLGRPAAARRDVDAGPAREHLASRRICPNATTASASSPRRRSPRRPRGR